MTADDIRSTYQGTEFCNQTELLAEIAAQLAELNALLAPLMRAQVVYERDAVARSGK